ncbi:MAG: hypothetical protein DWQ02_21090 [Bacteroidetes bacterium]|nr:MAG: hypothetical protein DWQ02_21090 [Bacteroidota bacterium]
MPSSSGYVNEDANQWLFNKAKHQRVNIHENGTAHSPFEKKTIYIETQNFEHGFTAMSLRINLMESDPNSADDELTGILYQGDIIELLKGGDVTMASSVGIAEDGTEQVFLSRHRDFSTIVAGTGSSNNPQRVKLSFQIREGWRQK